jgi:hypothetical protein
MPAKDHPIAVALIGAAAVVIAALIAYFATHQTKNDPVPTDYTVRVKDSKSHNPIGRAKVNLAEDQKPPQPYYTDSNGVVYVRLSSDVKTISLEVMAVGYDSQTINGLMAHTGTQEILLDPLPPPPTETEDPIETALEKLREQHKVSLVSPAFEGKELSEVPKNTYGFQMGEDITYKDRLPLTLMATREVEGSNGLFELHKLKDGHIELVGFVGPETFARYQTGLKSGDHISIYSISWKGAYDLVSVPLNSLVLPKGVRLAADGEVLDCTVR